METNITLQDIVDATILQPHVVADGVEPNLDDLEKEYKELKLYLNIDNVEETLESSNFIQKVKIITSCLDHIADYPYEEIKPVLRKYDSILILMKQINIKTEIVDHRFIINSTNELNLLLSNALLEHDQ